MRYDAYVFDFDLTLADSSQGILICFRHTLKAFGFEPPDDAEIVKTIGMPLIRELSLFTGVEQGERLDLMRREFIKKADEEMVKNTFFYGGVIDGLCRLRRSGARVGICSSKLRYRIEDSFKYRAGFVPVDIIVGADGVSAAKPDPQGLLLCIEELGAAKSRTLYVGDSVIDGETARRAGVDFAAVLTGAHRKEDFSEFSPVSISENAAELLENELKEGLVSEE